MTISSTTWEISSPADSFQPTKGETKEAPRRAAWRAWMGENKGSDSREFPIAEAPEPLKPRFRGRNIDHQIFEESGQSCRFLHHSFRSGVVGVYFDGNGLPGSLEFAGQILDRRHERFSAVAPVLRENARRWSLHRIKRGLNPSASSCGNPAGFSRPFLASAPAFLPGQQENGMNDRLN